MCWPTSSAAAPAVRQRLEMFLVRGRAWPSIAELLHAAGSSGEGSVGQRRRGCSCRIQLKTFLVAAERGHRSRSSLRAAGGSGGAVGRRADICSTITGA
ncbi:hypothetical protein RB620_24490 [Paenibacillus sp. LHD-117]|uniref:hypothetical protein n=1 Tax=Paenibacillus sp. LHD-117 TaxID=3071412 RepID=UPI0027E11A01|nr:hypothetical protein [Paenibacillus sp. LHD-117]MDQ6422595.1 hypothetical protein [Paenibacillus sp. LHD-117]